MTGVNRKTLNEDESIFIDKTNCASEEQVKIIILKSATRRHDTDRHKKMFMASRTIKSSARFLFEIR
jgi:hypothetical protein